MLTGKDLLSLEPDDDSGFSSSPPTPESAEDNDSVTQLFDFEKSLQSNFCGTLNACLFDGELPTKLYTHIRIKEEYDEELWENDISPSAFDSISFTDCFGEQYELMDDLLGQPTIDDERTEKPLQPGDIVSEEILAEGEANCTTCPKVDTNVIEEATTAEDTSPEDSKQNLNKRQLRKRLRNVLVDHDYVKSSDEAEVKNELDDDETDEISEETGDDDKDFEPPGGPAKKSRRTMKSKSGKDDKYWERRKRNNLAAKRSREAKRAREIEFAKKTAALEKENANLKNQVRKLKAVIKRAEKRLRAMV